MRKDVILRAAIYFSALGPNMPKSIIGTHERVARLIDSLCVFEGPLVGGYHQAQLNKIIKIHFSKPAPSFHACLV